MTTKKWTGFTLIGHFETTDNKKYNKNLNYTVSDRCAEEIEAELDEILLDIQQEEQNWGEKVWTDLCYICHKVEETPTMLRVNEEDENDDRLICDECYQKIGKSDHDKHKTE